MMNAVERQISASTTASRSWFLWSGLSQMYGTSITPSRVRTVFR